MGGVQVTHGVAHHNGGMSGVWKWIIDHQLAGWIGVSLGSLT
jgi:hypothetical protein